jgi:hypothetical protein
LRSPKSWVRSKFEQEFSAIEQAVTEKNRPPRAIASSIGDALAPVWISLIAPSLEKPGIALDFARVVAPKRRSAHAEIELETRA